MSVVKKLSNSDDLLIEKEKILCAKQNTKELSVTDILTDEDLEQWKKNNSGKLVTLKAWLEWQPHLPQKLPDELILLLLHSSFYSVDQAKVRLDAYFTTRTQAPEIFTNRNIYSEEMKIAQKITRISPLRCGTPEGYNVIYVDSLDPDVTHFNFTGAMKVAGIAIDVLSKCFPKEKGNILVFDMQHSAFAHVLKTNVFVLKKVMTYVQKALPFRLIGIHVINASPLIQMIHMLIKPFIDDNLNQLIHYHMQNNMSTLYDFIPKNYLPKEYGGQSESLEELNKKLVELMQDHEPYIKNMESLIVDEKKRVKAGT